MASTVLAEAVGYPGSSVAFAQLLSGMERSGLIEREIRGKRTYRIAAAPDAAGDVPGAAGVPAATAAGAGAGTAGAGTAGAGSAGAGTEGAGAVVARDAGGEPADPLAAAEPGELDYDELARRLLMQVVQRLAAVPPEPAADDAGLQETVASLEQKLASVQSKQRRLTAENAKLREQLRSAQHSLAQAQERAGHGGQLDTAEVRLLERLLSPLRQPRSGREEAGAG